MAFLLTHGPPLAGAGLRLTIRLACRWAETPTIQELSGISEFQIAGKQRNKRRPCGGVWTAVDFQTTIPHIVGSGACLLPRYFMIEKASPSACRLPYRAADSEDWVQRKIEAHSRLPQVAPHEIGER